MGMMEIDCRSLSEEEEACIRSDVERLLVQGLAAACILIKENNMVVSGILCQILWYCIVK